MKSKEFAEVYGIKDMTTSSMKAAISDWYKLYFGYGLPEEENNSLRLAFTTVNKIQKAVFSEYEISSKNNSDYASEIIDALNGINKKAMQQALIGGICWLKPLIFGERLRFSVVSRDNVVILGRDGANNITDIGTEEDSEQNGRFYTLFERRYVNSGRLIIDTRLYESENRDKRGHQIPLTALPRYSDIEPLNEIPIDNIGLIPVVCPAENCVDGSDDAVSVYAAAVGRIHDANVNEMQLCGEFSRGESRVFVSDDLLKKTAGGERKLKDNLFVGLDDDPEGVGITTFSPELREQSFLNRKMSYLRDIENIIGMKRGLLSDVEAAQRTATEITSSEGEYNLTIIDFQQAWEHAARLSVDVVTALRKAYKMPFENIAGDNLIIGWGDGILYNRDKTWNEYTAMVSMGLLKPELAVAWYFNLKHDTDADIEKIRRDYMPQLEELAGGE